MQITRTLAAGTSIGLAVTGGAAVLGYDHGLEHAEDPHDHEMSSRAMIGGGASLAMGGLLHALPQHTALGPGARVAGSVLALAGCALLAYGAASWVGHSVLDGTMSPTI